jgi:5-methylcytosine-specific restriction endonuclease McrA
LDPRERGVDVLYKLRLEWAGHPRTIDANSLSVATRSANSAAYRYPAPSGTNMNVEEPVLDPARAIALLERIQRLLRESSYTTTYKFAVLRALCDIAIESPQNTEVIHLERLAERVIELYWKQVRLFDIPGSSGAVMLSQSSMPNGKAAALTLVDDWVKAEHGRLSNAHTSGRMRDYRRLMTAALKKDVLRRLQPVDEPKFLYEWPAVKGELRICVGTFAAMRRFHGLLVDLIESEWARWVERRNTSIRGTDALREHLFGGERENLRAVVEPLLELQHGMCFYDNRKRIRPDSADVDHFIPWSLARNNSIGNLVLARSSFNSAKGDRLAPVADRARWEARNVDRAPQLQRIATNAGLQWAPEATLQIANWAYRRWSNAG